MNKFYLVRHGDVVKIPGDPGLSEIGVEKAKLTAECLADKDISSIYASPLRRTQETARYIADKLNLEIITDPRLRERMNWGDKVGQSFDDFLEEWNKTVEDRDFQPEVGDSSRQAGARMQSLVNELDVQYQNKNILLVTSGGVIADLLRNLFAENVVRSFMRDFPYHGLSECSITIITKDGDQVNLEEYNNTTHLTSFQ